MRSMFKKKNKFELTKRETGLAFALTFMSLLFTSKFVIQFLNKLNPLQGLLVYYVIVYGALFILSKLNLTIFGFVIRNPLQTLGLTMITFAFFIGVNWESPYINIVTHGSAENISPIYFQAEDGAVWYFWDTIVGFDNANLIWFLTYGLTTFLFALGGGLLVFEKVNIGGGSVV